MRAAGAALLHVDRLNKRFGAVVAAADITITVDRGECVSLIGSNGAGKTTLVNMITGYLKPDDGRISFDGRDIPALAPRAITRLGVARSVQIPQLSGDLTVLEVVRSFSSSYFPNTWQLALGLVLLFVIRFLPRGIGSLWMRR